MLPSLRRFGTHNHELVIDPVHDCFLLVVYPVISVVPVVVQPANMGTISAVCTRRLVVLDICRLLLSRLMCMTGRAARLPLCPCAKHMPLSRRRGTAKVDRPEGWHAAPGTWRSGDPGAARGARQQCIRDDDMTLYRHWHLMWSTHDTRLWCESVRSYGSSKNASETSSRLQRIRGSFRGDGTRVSGQRWAREAAVGHIDFVALWGDNEEWAVSARGPFPAFP